jgi:hypothetical protein
MRGYCDTRENAAGVAQKALARLERSAEESPRIVAIGSTSPRTVRLSVTIAATFSIAAVAAALSFLLSYYHGYIWSSRQGLVYEIAVFKIFCLLIGLVLLLAWKGARFSVKVKGLSLVLSFGLLGAGVIPGVIRVRSKCYLRGLAYRVAQLRIDVQALKQDTQGNSLPLQLSALNPGEFAFKSLTANGVTFVWGNRSSGGWGIEVSEAARAGENILPAGTHTYVFFEYPF